MAMENEQIQQEKNKKGLITWVKRLGFAGFMFFFLKGLVWLAVFYGGAKFIGCGD